MSEIKSFVGSAHFMPIDPYEVMRQETRKIIVNTLYYEGPLTVKQLSDKLHMAQSVVHKHKNHLLAHDLIKEVDADDRRKSPVERFYDFNIPVVRLSDMEILEPLFRKIAAEITAQYIKALEAHKKELKEAFDRCSFKNKGWKFEDAPIKKYLYEMGVNDAVNEHLREKKILPDEWIAHPDGAKWTIIGFEGQE